MMEGCARLREPGGFSRLAVAFTGHSGWGEQVNVETSMNQGLKYLLVGFLGCGWFVGISFGEMDARLDGLTALQGQLVESVAAEQVEIRNLRDGLYELGVTIRKVRLEAEQIMARSGLEGEALDGLRQALLDSVAWMRAIREQTDVLLSLQRRQSDHASSLEGEIAGLRVLLDGLGPRDESGMVAEAGIDVSGYLEALAQREAEVSELRSQVEALLAERDVAAAAGTGLEEVEARFAEELGLREAEIAELRLQVESLLAESVRVSPAALELIAEGDRLLVLGLLDEARDLFLGALDIDPELVDARLGLAAWAFDAGRLDEVRLTVAEVLAEDPENARAISLKGLVLWQDGEFMAAKDALEQAIRLSPNESQFFNYLGIIRFDLGDEAGSLASFGRAVELDGGNPGALYNYAFALARQPEADMDLARTMYEEALRQGSPPDEELERILFP